MTLKTPSVAFVIHDIIHFRASVSMARAIDSQFTIHFYFLNEIVLELCQKDIPSGYVRDVLFGVLLQRLSLSNARNVAKSNEEEQKSALSHVLDFLFQCLRVVIPRPLRRLMWSCIVNHKKYMVPMGLWRHWLRACAFQRILRRHRPNILVLNQADVESKSELYLRSARAFNIRTMINPFTFCSTDSILKYFETCLDRSLANRFDATILRRLFPQWFHPHRDYILMRSSPAVFIATSMLGYRYTAPWKQDYSSADILLVDNAIALKHYQNMDFPDAQLRCIGLPEHDVLNQRLKDRQALYNTLCQEYGLDSSLKLAVIALPPEYDLGLERSEFSSFYEFISFVSVPFQAGGWNILLCPHPRSPIADYNASADRVKIAHQPTIDLVPLSDVYVSFVSVTIKWANFCGIPALNYDVYATKDFDHLQTDNIISVDTKAEYENAAMALCTDPAYYAQWKTKQQENRHLWGNTNGTAKQELVTLLHELVQQSTPTKRTA